MKKLFAKDKKLRLEVRKKEKHRFILKSIFSNNNFFILIRWNAISKLKSLSKTGNKVSVSPRCLETINRKRFNKETYFSRQVFLKLLRSGKLSGFRKASW